MQLYTYYQDGSFKAEIAIPDETPTVLIAQVEAVSDELLVVVGTNLDDKDPVNRVANVYAFGGHILFQNISG